MKVFYKRLLSIGIAVGVFCALTVFTAGQTQWTAMEIRKKALESDIYKIESSPEPRRVNGMGLPFVRRVQSLLPPELKSDLMAPARETVVSYDGEPLPAGNVIGTDVNLAEIMDFQIISGRYLTPEDIDGYRKVCVLKSNVYDLVKARNATHMDINGESFEIVGVVAGNEGNTIFVGSGDVFVPITTLYKYFEKTSEMSGIIYQIVLDKEGYSRDEIWDGMRQRAEADGVDISGLRLLPQQYDLITGNEEFIREFSLVFLLSLLVLLIASINIIHIATASIMDREREIGLRTALGAKPGSISRQITAEILLCSLQGGMGGIAAASVLNTMANLGLGQFGLSFNTLSLSAGLILAALAGLITSLIPAAKAVRLEPAAALREE